MWITTVWEKVKSKLFGKSAFERSAAGHTIVTDEMSAAIDRWIDLYSNKAPWLTRDRHSLGLPSAISREIATMVTVEMSAKVSAVNDAESARAEAIDAVFAKALDNIRTQAEYACAFGGLVFKPYVANGAIQLDFVHADDFYPIAYNGRGEITSALFLEHKKHGQDFYTRVEQHDIGADGYTITNKAFRSYSANDIGTEVSLTDVDEWRDIQPTVTINGATVPLFAYFKIEFGNVIDARSQLGVSVYARADAAGLLEEADRQWQRFMWEYEGGEMAIDASADAFKHVKTRTGELIPVLPEGKERLFRVNNISATMGGNAAEMMKVYAPALRDSNFAQGLNNVLMRIEDACGISRGTFSDANETARTATELRISRQRTYATVTAIQRSLQAALEDLAKAADVLLTLYDLAPEGEWQTAYVWDDSVIVDADTERKNDRQDVLDGMMLPWEYRVKWYGETEEKARAAIAEVSAAVNADSFIKSTDEMME